MAKTKTWLKKFDPEMEFVVSKTGFLDIDGKRVELGERLVKEDYNPRRLRQLYESRRIAVDISVATLIAEAEKKAALESEPNIIVEPFDFENGRIIIKEEEKGWIKVYVDSEQIGKATRDRKEAEEIALEWINENA